MSHGPGATSSTISFLVALGIGPVFGDVHPPPDGSFTIAVLPDTQVYTYVDSYREIFLGQTRWIAENHERQKIAFVLHVGDVTEHDTLPEWRLARQAFQMLDAAGVPYVITLGNHDYGTVPGAKDSLETPFNDPELFGPGSAYARQPTVGGFMIEGRSDNSFHTFRAGERDWIVLALEWQPPPDVIAWANAVLDDHPRHTAILLTHEYLSSALQPAPAARTAVGNALWQGLVSRHGFAFVFCGHELGTGRTTSVGSFGQVVHQMLANYQGQANGGDGYLRLLQVLPDSRTVRVRTHSTHLDALRRTPDEHFDLVLCEPSGAASSQVPDECLPDCDGDGVPDVREIASRSSLDADRNGYPDECDVHAELSVTPNEDGSEGEAPLEVLLDAGATTTAPGGEIVSYEWSLGDGTTAQGPSVTHTYTTPGPKRVTVQARDDREMVGSASRDVAVLFASSDVSPWSSTDLGEVGFPGGSRVDGDCLTVFAGGGNLRSTVDRCRFVYQEIGALSTLVVRVSSLELDGFGQATMSLVLRESLDPGARDVALLLFGSGSVQLYSRGEPEGRASWVASRSTRLPDLWLRLGRRGRRIFSSTSADGVTWEELPLVELDLGDSPLLGIAAFSSSLRANVTVEVCDLELSERDHGGFTRGDSNDDARVDVSDAIFDLEWLFLGGPAPGCLAAANSNGDEVVNGADPVYLLHHLFLGTPAPVEPFPRCGASNLAVDVALGCETPLSPCP